ncbi:MAG: hypothetical protein IKN12_01105 [Selenomonadaceae bacterium]|nr:hypothetical protein [Selenomonadaceae bacterium]
MDIETTKPPRMMTVREIAKLGIMPEHALRIMLKAGQLPALYVGKKALVNYDKLCDLLRNLEIAAPISQSYKKD